ncbi:bifunctional 3-phenylpropionate/cinnamic acid dioxygenase ferredoxin subunit [Rhodococcus sp. BP-349]|uniref:3-phenylpropionate/trans-cinnamate dioxygenase ferredoxin subunit/ethylbenzene dioxygenase ferredoxin subunit n=1 Tax=Rhodococcoides corynebacterioides TaxID=53972 RepID=A0ABS2KSL9_9NOCA|nr:MULTISPECIES: bifunctional 3-phenylpropionate/cinnamic acid dioxygenase ferredoxin subunit [Rhodococcus]MBM7414888.1 3-phenylpropionate/trans-cinnamate dioxygenase ferredoxin subunit/ethylbenzene dioxygenase ferredoxin subunit [Rhodococcus corynebacterioides]MBP1117350.1 3-phenylpropionate/trans-cinnamate dioxygenase ferredoxin subunit/ethylbenzene dioxygenase ferredoxin subunit [Rhodococcus sp. PvP016]MBY6540956.1 bifunctional 3-phenylpropionate/cinnamic acid dioxygenase ferredoxin subunit [
MPDTVHRVAVCSASALPLGEVATVTPPGHTAISVFHTEEGLFAIDDTCTHQDASLADGWVENCAVECPLHESCFDLRTGAPSGTPAKTPVRTYAVHVVDGAVVLDLPGS